MISIYNEEEKKKREEEFDRLFGNNLISNNSEEYIQRANEFDRVFGGNNINPNEYVRRSQEFDEMFGKKNDIEEINEIEKVEEDIASTIEENKEETPEYENRLNSIMNSNFLKRDNVEMKKDTEESKNENINNIEKDSSVSGNVSRIIENFGLGADSGIKNLANFTYASSESHRKETMGNQVQTNANKVKNSDDLTDEEKRMYFLTNAEHSKSINENISNALAKNPLDDTIKSNEERIQTNILKQDNIVSRKLAELMPSVGNMAIGALASAVNPYVGGTYFVLSAAGSYMDDAKARGMNEKQAITYGTILGALEGITEEITWGNIAKGGSIVKSLISSSGKEATKTIAKETAKSGIKEALKNFGVGVSENFAQEAIIEPLQELTAQNVAGAEYANWENMGQRMLQAGIDGALTSIIMLGADAGVNSCIGLVDKIRNQRSISKEEIKQAITDASKNGVDVEEELKNSMNLAIENGINNINDLIADEIIITENNIELFNDGIENVGLCYVTKFNEDGQVQEVVETLGKQIENPNPDLQINPVIIKDQQNQTFNIIDGNTGVILDTTQYNSVKDAEIGFNETVSSLSNEQIESINNKITKSTISLYDEIGKIVQERQQEILSQQEKQNGGIEQNNIASQENNNEENKIAQNGISNETDNNILKSFEDIASDAMEKAEITEVESPLQNRNIETIGKEKSVNAYQYDNPEVKPYFKEMAQMIGEDLSYISSVENRSTKKGGGTKLSTMTNAIDILHNQMGYSYDQISQGIQNIIQDNGQENNAVSKKLELIIDDQLRNGYTNALGKNVTPNQEYINVINQEGGKNNVRTEKIKNNNSQQGIGRTNEGKNTKGEKEISRSNGISQEKLSKSIQQFQKEQQKHLGKDFKISQTAQNKLTNTEKTIQNEFTKITGLNYGIYETSQNSTEDAVYVNNDILVKHDSLRSKKKANFLPFHELGHWFEENRNAEWTEIHDIIDRTITDSQIEQYKKVLKDKSLFNNMSELETREYIIREIESDYFGNWANDISNWADMIRNKMLSDEYVQLLIDISDENISTHYNIFGTQEQQEQVYNQINEMMNNFITENKNSLKSNSESNTKQTKDVDFKKEFHNRIQNALINKNSKRRINFGIVDSITASKINKITGINVEQRKHILLDNDIRHMINEHSDKIAEAKKKQIPITPKDIELIPDVINEYDKIIKGSDNKGEQTIRYIKNMGKNKIYVVEVVPSIQNDLIIKTMWIKPIRVINSQQTPNLTSKTKPNAGNSTFVTNSIAQKNKTVKSDTTTNSNMQKSKNNTIKKSERTLFERNNPDLFYNYFNKENSKNKLTYPNSKMQEFIMKNDIKQIDNKNQFIRTVINREGNSYWGNMFKDIIFRDAKYKNEIIKSYLEKQNEKSNSNIKYSARYDTEQNGEGGFYSQLENIIEEKMPNTSNSQQIKGIIENSGIKQDEIKWIGLDDYLKQHSLEKITKQQLLDYIRANQINIETVRKSMDNLESFTAPIKEDIENKKIEIKNILNKYNIDYEDDDVTPYSPNGLRLGTIGDFEADNLAKLVDLDNFEKAGENYTNEYMAGDGVTKWVSEFTEEDFKNDMQNLADLYEELHEAELNLSMAEDEYRDNAEEIGTPQYDRYSLDGGTNYQEILYTLPLKNQNQDEFIKLNGEIAELKAKAYLSDPVLATDEERLELNRINAEINKKQEQINNLEKLDDSTYKSPHWSEKNVLAHARTQDFEDTSGNKVLFIDEIQSDLHQEGRKKGYISKEERLSREEVKKKRYELGNELRVLNEKYNNQLEEYIENTDTYKAWIKAQDDLGAVKFNLSQKIAKANNTYDFNAYDTIEDIKREFESITVNNKEDIINRVAEDIRLTLTLKGWKLTSISKSDLKKLYEAVYNLEQARENKMNERFKIGNEFRMTKEAQKIEKRQSEITDEMKNLELKSDGISDIFPFKKNWHEFVLRRLINNAVEQGYDEVAWTTGRQQRERYNLSKVIDSIEYERLYYHPNNVDKGNVDLVDIFAKKNGEVVFSRAINPEELSDYIGKDLATRILSSKESKGTISNLDEEIRQNGNSGMYLFYDQEIPNYLNKYLKKWNSKVEEILLKDADGKDESKQMGFKITDEMRNSIKQNGQPLFSNRQLSEEKASSYDKKIQQKNQEFIKELKQQKIQGLENYSRKEIKDIVNRYIDEIFENNGIDDITIKGSEIIGSRNRGNAKNNSDLDIVVEYDGDIREDDLFDMLNENPLEIDGIRVDINPITANKTGTLKEYLERSNQYDKDILNNINKENIKKEDIEVNPGATNAQGSNRFIEQEIRKLEKTGNWDYSIPVTKLTDIRKTIEEYLGLGIKKGHFRERAYGIYKQGRDVIRGKELKDIDNILHETGHALDLGNRLKIDKESIASELLTAVKKHGGYENEKRSVKLEEGFAEVIREYSIIPEQAKKDYPQSVTVLEEIRKADKSFDDFISKVQQQTYNYIHQNPQNRVHSNLSVGEQTDRTPLTKAWLEQEVMRNVWDKDYAVKKAVNEFSKIGDKKPKASDNAYYLTRLASGIHDKVTSMLSEGYINENGIRIMPGLKKVGEILGDDPQRYNDLRDYLVAKRDTDYKAKTLKTGIRDMDTKFVLEKFKNDEQIKKAAKVVYDTLDGVMQYAVDNGLISQDDVKKLKESNAFYVPMQRVIEGQGNQLGRKGAVADITKRRTGSELDIKDVLENIVANSSNIIQQVENNNVLKALYNQGEEVGLTGSIYDVIDTPVTKIGTANLSMWEKELKKQGVNTDKLDLEKTIDLFAPNNKVDAKNLITSFINKNGKRVYLHFNDKILFNSLMNLDGEFMSKFLTINSWLNMPLRYGATMANIGFAIPNMISDTAQAMIYSEAGFIPIIDNALGVLDVLTAKNESVRNFVKKYSPEYVKRIENMYSIYKQSGATTATRMSQYRDSTQSQMKDVYGVKHNKILGIDEKYKSLKRLLDLMTYIPEISEQSTRFRVFERSYEAFKNKGNSETDARIMAALESRDATQDFGRTGNITREINQLIPFSAARVGSSYTFYEKAKANPKRIAMRVALLSALAMAIKAIGYDDKDIEELNQRKKDDNFVLKVGDNVVTIKKPQGLLRSIINLTEYIQDLATEHIEDGKEGERLGEWIHNALWDNMPADSIRGLVPNMVAPLIENAVNKDFYYNTDIVKNWDLDLPDSEQYYEYNSQLAILLGKIFNYSPAKIDNLISGYFAGLGTQVTGIMDYTMGKAGLIAEKPEMGAESDAVGKRFVVNVNTNSQSTNDIYERKTELTKKKNGGTITSEEEKELETITTAITNMSKINKQIKEIKADLTTSGEEKARLIKELQAQRTDIARQALGKDLINEDNASKIEETSFYPTNSSLSQNNYKLELTKEMKEEYANIASEFYKKYESQGLYNEDKLKEIRTKAKDYAKKTLMKKYKNQLIKSK